MNILINFFKNLMTGVSLLTALGVFMHDGRVDKAASTALYGPLRLVTANGTIVQRYQDFVSGDAHTHPDHNAARSALLNSFAYQSPSVPPKGNDQKRHDNDELRARGHHAFDNATLPVIV
jgi:hypothetical protein